MIMKTNDKLWIRLFLILTLVAFIIPIYAQNENMITVSGYVKDKNTKRALSNVNITMPQTHIGTVTNADGYFMLKIKSPDINKSLEFSHIGYLNNKVPLASKNLTNVMVLLLPTSNVLTEIVVFNVHPRKVLEQAIRKISENYSANENLLTSFYRETMQKRNRYIGISEAVMDIYKTSYNNRSANKDRVQILKSRRLLSQKQSDTLAVKLAGGPTLPVYMDLVKNENLFLNLDDLDSYQFIMENPVCVDDDVQYVISFRPIVNKEYAMLHGKVYVDRESLSFTRAEMYLDMRDKDKAINSILFKKPIGLRFNPQEVSYLITYKTIDNITYLNYICNRIRFKCDWKKKLFSTGYTIDSEMVVTDKSQNDISPIHWRDAFGNKQVFYDKVDDYWNKDFWEAYNIIEPTESLENAVTKLKKQSD